jgi:hypothetical protein
MFPRPRRLWVWIALAVYGLAGVVSARGLVLCLEADGHVKIEREAAGCGSCCSDEERGEEGASLDDCACVDVAIGSPDAPLLKLRSDVAPFAAWTRELPWSSALGSLCARRSASAYPRTTASPALAHVRTVVLLL